MSIASVLDPARVHLDVQTSSKKRALEQLSVWLAEGDDEPSAGQIFDALLGRERLGSTGFGFGVAIPHARHAAAREARGACMRLATPIDFDAIDHEPVDFVFGLLVPDAAADEHVQTLADLAGLFSDETVREQLRAATTAEQLVDILLQTPPD